MKKQYLSFFSALLLILPLVFSPFFFTAEAAIADWQRGASIQPRNGTDFGSESLKRSLDNLKDTGANYVSFVIPYYQASLYAVDMFSGWNTPTNDSLREGIRYAHSIGLKVGLKFHLESQDGQWRAHINPWDKDRWFASYRDALSRYASVAAEEGAEELIIGTELITMSTDWANADRWNALIGHIRSIYPGKLGYSANWGGDDFTEETPDVRFWGALDYIGISGYYPLSSAGNSSVESMKGSWDHWSRTKIQPIADQYGKPVMLTEVGYRSVNDSYTDAWNSWRGGWYDPTAQANAYTALFSFWNGQSYMKGVLLWDWSSDPFAGGEGDTGYTPQRKPAEQVMKDWWKGLPPPAPETPPTGPVSFTAAVQTTPSQLSLGQSVSLSANVTSGSSGASGAIADIEIYDQAGARTFQQFYEGQNFSSNETRIYNASWTPSAAGVYTVKLGVFGSAWQSYAWNDAAASFSVSQGDTTPPPPPPVTETLPASVNVWWPTDGATVSGIQPFKAEVQGRDVATYAMYWQVDSDRLNPMEDSPVDYPHKEALVDLAGWTWKGTGPYTLTFVAQEKSGSTIATRSVNIFIAQ